MITRLVNYAVLLIAAIFAGSSTAASSDAYSQQQMIEKAESMVSAQLVESLHVTGVSEAIEQLGASGDGIGVLVIDDWNSIIPGVPHGESVVEIIRKTAPGASVWTCKLDFSIALISDFLGCLDEMESRGLAVQIVNMSFSMGDKFYPSPCGTDLTEFGRAIHRLSQKGVIFVGSAGNQGVMTGMRFPACHDDVISVGATYDYDGAEVSFEGDDFSCTDLARLDQMTCYSNRAKYLDLLAPGTTVSTSVNPQFGGTSASAPLVSGIIALMLSKAPQLTRAEVLRVLQSTGKSVYDANTRKSFARVDAFEAISSISTSAAKTRNEAGLALKQQSLAGFDGNQSGHIDDSEFFQAVDFWIQEKINDDLFFSVIDAWTSQAAVQGAQPAPSAIGNLLTIKQRAAHLTFSAGSGAEMTRVAIFDGSGRQVYEARGKGSQLRWNLQSNQTGRPLANGIYFYLMEANVNGQMLRQTGKILVLR